MNPGRKPELLAPAGDMEKLRCAFLFGADAVYAGAENYGLRARAGNFTPAELAEAVAYAHGQGKKLYVTVNIFAQEDDFAGLAELLAELARIGADGAIISDPGVLMLARAAAPALPLHLSTQANCLNARAAEFWFGQGLRRVVLARELSLPELTAVAAAAAGELEIFVHGAMCVAYSGRCLLSRYLTGRDANRGDCAQPCRWAYALTETGRPGQYFPLEEDGRGSYILNSRDLCLLPLLPLLRPLGFTSWKIEGRMKSVHYVASTVQVYRQAIDTLWDEGEAAFAARLPDWLAELGKASHRPFTTGFLLPETPDATAAEGGYEREYDFVARVLGPAADGRVEVEERNAFRLGETLEILAPASAARSFRVTEITGADGRPRDSARHAQEIVALNIPGGAPPGSLLRRRKAETLPPLADSDRLIYARVDRADIQLLTKYLEGLGHLGVVTTADRQAGEVLIQTTRSAWPELREMIMALPLPVELTAEGE
jgi:putative protease